MSVVDQHTVEFPLKSFTSEYEGAIIGLVFVYSSKYINDMGREPCLPESDRHRAFPDGKLDTERRVHR